jgi:PhoH-like ATPase
MTTTKNYVIDTNVLLEDPSSLLKLRNGSENKVYIPYHVLMELSKFKKDPKLGYIVAKVIQLLNDNPDQYSVLKSNEIADPFTKIIDNYILNEIIQSGITEPILVTNDKIFQLQARLKGIHSESYKESVPFKSEAEYYTGFVESHDERVLNSFLWSNQGKPVFWGIDGEKVIDYQHKIWNVVPRNVYQNLAMELMTRTEIDLVSIQSEAGYGKSFLALAAALFLTHEKKTHEKVYVIKPMIEIGSKLGYLPGSINEKMEPYTKYITDLLLKLHRLRPVKKVFLNEEGPTLRFDSKKFELLPLAYIRGMNIEHSVVIIDEVQNLSRIECRALLSRMGEGVKCFCLGDIRQVDNPYLNIENNGLNWIVNKFKGHRIYAHIVLKGDKSRGPITDLVINSGL